MIFSTRNFSLVLALVLVLGTLGYTDNFHDEGPLYYASTGITQLDSDQLDNFDFHYSMPGSFVYFAPEFYSSAVAILSPLASLFILPESRAPPRVSF